MWILKNCFIFIAIEIFFWHLQLFFVEHKLKLKIEALSTHWYTFLLQQIYCDFIHPTKPGSFSREFLCKQSMQGEAAYHLFQSFKKVILCIIDEFISSLPQAKNLIFGE